MKRKHRTLAPLALVTVAKPQIVEPKTRDERLAAAKEWLGTRYVLHRDYSPRVRVGHFLNAWRAKNGQEARKQCSA